MTKPNYSMTDLVNLATELEEMANFQNSIVWNSDCFTWTLQEEYLKVLSDKASELKEYLNDIEWKAEFKS